MLVRLLFEENKCVGYLAYMKEVYPYEDRENITMIESNDAELTDVIGHNWKEEFINLTLINGEVQVNIDGVE